MAKKKNNTRQFELNKIQSKRLLLLLFVVFGCFFILVGKLVYLQFFEKTEKYNQQVSQSIEEVFVSAPRGNICDKDGNILVKDSSSSTVCVVPNRVPKDKEESTAKILSDSLSENRVDMLEVVTRLEDQKVEIKRNVSDEIGEKLINNEKLKNGFYFIDGTLYCIPMKVKKPDEAAKVIASELDMSSDKVKEYLTQKENSPVEIKNKVDYNIAQGIIKKIAEYDEDGKITSSNGVELKDDNKRLYINDRFAAFVLGFTDKEHKGLQGIEYSLNDELCGEKGVAYYQKDALGNIIPSQTKIVKKAKQGKDIYLSIDSSIQSITENALNKAVSEWKAKSGTAIVMETKTGKILGMAVAPGYSINEPYSISDDFKSHRGEDLKDKTESEQILETWKNLAIAFIYEPGSTFKAITTSAALEEGVVSPDDMVYCNGAYVVNGIPVKCTGNHGWQTVREAVANSCNPGLIQIIQKLDPNVFYRYMYNFGYGEKTGIELPGEESGIINNVVDEDGSINLLEYSTMSFGQALATTPIQNLTALNAVVNNGHYVKPSILSDQNVDLTINGRLGVSKQIISAETSAEMRNIMEQVVLISPTLTKLASGNRMGGKTGTAEKFADGAYLKDSFVTSFFCFAPVDDPKYSIIVTIDDAKDCPYASVSSAPVAMAIMNQLLTGNVSDDWISGTEPVVDIGNCLVPDLIDQNIQSAEKILKERNISYHITKDASGGDTVLTQSIEAKTKYDKSSVLEITIGKSEKDTSDMVRVPDLEGLSIQFANELLNGLGLNMKVKGSGFVTKQNQAAGTRVKKESVIEIECSK